jgi:hypothetical protein
VFYLLGIYKGLDKRFWQLLKLLPGAVVIKNGSLGLGEIVIPGCSNDGYLLGSSIFFEEILAINQIKVVYTLLDSPILKRLSDCYHFIIILLSDDKYNEKLLLHKFNIVKYLATLKKVKLNNLCVYGNKDLASKLKIPAITSISNQKVIINCDPNIFTKEKLFSKIIFDFVARQPGFLYLELKEADITFIAVNQYLGQIMTKSGAKLIYDSLVRNRVNN